MSEPPALPPSLAPQSIESSETATSATRLMAQLLWVEALLISIWVIAVASFQGSGGTVAHGVVTTFGAIYPIHLIVTGLTIWSRIKHGAPTRLTAILIAAPWVSLPVPFLLNRLNDVGPLLDSPQKITNAIVGLLVLAVGLLLARPRQSARLIPLFVLRSFGLNLVLCLGTLALYVLPIGFMLIKWGKLAATDANGNDGYLLAYGLGASMVYGMACALPSTIVAIYSGLSLFQKEIIAHRKWRIAQLIISTPLVLLGVSLLVLVWLQKF